SASSLAQPLAQRALKSDGRCTTNEKIMSLKLADEVDDPQISFASLAATLSITQEAPGVVGLAYYHQNGISSLVIRISGRVEPAEEEIDLGEGRTVSAYDVGSLQVRYFIPFFKPDMKNGKPYPWDQYELSRYDLDYDKRIHYIYANLDLRNIEPNTDDPCYCIFGMRTHQGDFDEYMVLQNSASAMADEDSEPEYCMAGNQFFVVTRARDKDNRSSRFEEVEKNNPSPISTELLFVDLPGAAIESRVETLMQKGGLQGRMILPMKPGSSMVTVAGLEGIKVDGYDADVASNACVANPNMSTYLDGVVVHLQHLRRTGPGAQPDSLKARICLNRLIEFTSTKDLGGDEGVLGIIDKPRFEKGSMCGEFPCDGKIHILGTLTGERGDQQRTLYVLGRAGSDKTQSAK
ncbi:MAG: hypothetical protein ABIK28_06065, partial [Planctomycetota bacterium]